LKKGSIHRVFQLTNHYIEGEINRLEHATQQEVVDYLNREILESRFFNTDAFLFVIPMIQRRFYGNFETPEHLSRALRDIPALMRYARYPQFIPNITGSYFGDLVDLIGPQETVRAINHYLDEEKNERNAIRIVGNAIENLLSSDSRSKTALKNIRIPDRFPRIRQYVFRRELSKHVEPETPESDFLHKKTVTLSPRQSYLQRKTRKPSEETECSICLENLNEGKTTIRLDCGHMFHKKCLLPWLSKNECPLCRSKIQS
jgi:hypothetical protein